MTAPKLFEEFKSDLSASIVGGIVVGIASGSPLGVSGPGNSLTILVLSSLASLGGPGRNS
jgi:MFS superfamily sulfate permease-like transporter